jgi:hypothetical protein
MNFYPVSIIYQAVHVEILLLLIKKVRAVRMFVFPLHIEALRVA